jgi:2-iminobutanoate/2-iminopropanoate deaminase
MSEPGASERHFSAGGQGGLPPAIAPFSQAVRAGSLVMTAGQAALDQKGEIVGEGDVREQTRQTLDNVKAALESAGATMRDVVKITIWLRDFNDYKGMNEVYAKYFAAPEPVRACVRSDLVFPSLLVEIEATAVLDG